jgi:Peptidase_C39 like family
VRPLDSRLTVAAAEFARQADGAWVTHEVEPAFPFDEMIYSWHLRLEAEQGFRLYLQVKSVKGDSSPWLYGGYWGSVKNLAKRTEPQFKWGKVAMDQLLLQRKAKTFQLKIVDEGAAPLTKPPTFSVVVTDNAPTPALAQQTTPARTPSGAPTRILDLPFRRQADSKGTPIPDRCQSAALATAMQYFGKPIGLEDIVCLNFDVEYDFPGIWPRTIGAGIQHGFDGYIDRFRDWESVRRTVAQNKVILCSIRMFPGNYKAPPYPQIGGHIVALNGVTDDGRVIVTDSYLWKENKGYQCQWLQEDFEKVWMKAKGGVGMVICPPPQAEMKLVTELPPFPSDRFNPATTAKPGGS